MKNLLKQWLGAPARTSSKCRAHSLRPLVESLESREVPAVLLVNTTADVVNPSDQRLSLREAINFANGTAEADTIRLPAGSFTIEPSNVFDPGGNLNRSGDFDIRGSVSIIGAGKFSTVIDANSRDRIFDVHGDIRATFANLTVREGFSTQDGGAIRAAVGDVVLNNVVVRQSRAANGGGVFAGQGNVTAVSSTVLSNNARFDGGGVFAREAVLSGTSIDTNSAGDEGGGLFASDSAIVTGGEFFQNAAERAGGGLIALNTARLVDARLIINRATGTFARGGGLLTSGLSLSGGEVRGNTAATGAGVAATTAAINRATISGNFASVEGGGVYTLGTASITASTIDGNVAERGGGVFASAANVTTSTISNNRARDFGGGIETSVANVMASTVSGNSAGTNGGGFSASTVNVVNSTVSGNSARNGGGLYVIRGRLLNATIADNLSSQGGAGVHLTSATESVRVKNTIIARNTNSNPFSTAEDVSGVFISEGHNLIGVALQSNGFNGPGDQAGTFGIPLDPKLGALADNGGPTKTHALLSGSTAIDRGDNAAAPATDQRGIARPRDGNGDGILVADIGAFEV